MLLGGTRCSPRQRAEPVKTIVDRAGRAEHGMTGISYSMGPRLLIRRRPGRGHQAVGCMNQPEGSAAMFHGRQAHLAVEHEDPARGLRDLLDAGHDHRRRTTATDGPCSATAIDVRAGTATFPERAAPLHADVNRVSCLARGADPTRSGTRKACARP